VQLLGHGQNRIGSRRFLFRFDTSRDVGRISPSRHAYVIPSGTDPGRIYLRSVLRRDIRACRQPFLERPDIVQEADRIKLDKHDLEPLAYRLRGSCICQRR
jgi:hypothetical protein